MLKVFDLISEDDLSTDVDLYQLKVNGSVISNDRNSLLSHYNIDNFSSIECIKKDLVSAVKYSILIYPGHEMKAVNITLFNRIETAESLQFLLFGSLWDGLQPLFLCGTGQKIDLLKPGSLLDVPEVVHNSPCFMLNEAKEASVSLF